MSSFVAAPARRRPSNATRSARALGASLLALASVVLASSLALGCSRGPGGGPAGSPGGEAASATGPKSAAPSAPCDLAAFGRSRVDEKVREYAKTSDSENDIGIIDGPTAAVVGELQTISYTLLISGTNSAWNEQEIWACANGAMVQVNDRLPKIDKRFEKDRSSQPSITSVGGNRYEVAFTVWLDSDPNCCPSTQNVITVELQGGIFQVVKSEVR